MRINLVPGVRCLCYAFHYYSPPILQKAFPYPTHHTQPPTPFIPLSTLASLSKNEHTVYHEECIYTTFCTAIALHSMHLFQSHFIIFSPTHPCLYIYFFTFGLHRIDMGVFLEGGNGHAYVSCRLLLGLPLAMR